MYVRIIKMNVNTISNYSTFCVPNTNFSVYVFEYIKCIPN